MKRLLALMLASTAFAHAQYVVTTPDQAACVAAASAAKGTCLVPYVPPVVPPVVTPPAGPTWTRLASEGATFTVTGPSTVRFGFATTNAWVQKDFAAGTYPCTIAAFGSDPAPNNGKACERSSVVPTLPPVVVVPPVVTPPPAGAVAVSLPADKASDFLNPERGFYVTPKDGEMTVTALTNFSKQYNVSLFLYHVNLDSYRNTATLPQSFIDALNTRFAAGRAAGFKFIAFPHYNYAMNGADAPLSIALGHIKQLGPVWERNADVVPFIKAGYVGSYGEWWGSTNGLDSDASKLAIKNAIQANTPASTIVHYRYPSDIRKWYADPKAAAGARVAPHNDCYMANNTDGHTYPAGLGDSLRQYNMALSSEVGFGAETCDNVSNPEQQRLTCAQALVDHGQFHATWLNASYSPKFISAWKAGKCYEEISRGLGYRLRITTVTLPPALAPGQAGSATVAVTNDGWSRLLSRRPLVVTLTRGSTRYSYSSTALLSGIGAGADASIPVAIALPADAPAGEYDVAVSAPDVWATTSSNAKFAVRFANAGTVDAAGRLATGAKILVQVQ